MMLPHPVTMVIIFLIFCGGCLYILKEYKKQQLRYRKKLLGNYTNQENHFAFSPGKTHLITMTLRTDIVYGDINGFMNSKNLVDGSELLNIPLYGKLRYNSGVVVMNNFSGTELQELGKAEITISGNVVKCKFKTNHTFFPKEAIFHKPVA